jgi:hypothetical protein
MYRPPDPWNLWGSVFAVVHDPYFGTHYVLQPAADLCPLAVSFDKQPEQFVVHLIVRPFMSE